MSEVLVTIVAFMVLFWGSRRDVEGTRIMLFGVFTIYSSRLELALPPLRQVSSTSDEVDDEDDDREHDRHLWKRLADAGFETIDDARSLRLGDVGRIEWLECDYICGECECQLYDLWEVYQAPSDNPALVGHVKKNPLGRICVSCGDCQQIEGDEPVNFGIIMPVVESGTNFFDVLDHFERLRQPPPAATAAEEPIPGATAYPNR